MGLFNDFASIFGKSPAKDAAGTVAKANEAAGTGVFDASKRSQGDVQSALDAANAGVNGAGQKITDATVAGNSTLQGLLDSANGNFAPGIVSGQQGNTALQNYVASNPTFHAPTAEEVAQTPGFQFQLQQGSNAITNQLAGQGLNNSGKALTDLTQYGQGLAGTYYNDAFNRAQQQFQTNQNATLNNLQALIGAGNTANSQSIAAGQAFGAPQAENTINAANNNANLQQFLGSLNLGGQENRGATDVNSAITGGNFFVNGANATAAGQLANGQGLANLLGDASKAVGIIPGLGGSTGTLSSLLGLL